MHHRALGDEEVYRICVGDDDSTRPMFANGAYHRHVNARIEKARATTSSREEMIETLSRQRPITHPLIVLLICGGFVGAVFAANFAMPFFGWGAIQEQVAESIKLAHPVQRAVARAYADSGKLPADLAATGLDAADYQSKYLTINVIDGMVLIVYSKQADPKIANSTLSFRPVPLDGGGIAWSCGYFQSSERDTVYGTNIDAEYLPSECRARSP